MSISAITKTFDLGDGRKISIETGKLAKQAHGAVVVRMDNTMLLATVVSNKEPKEDVDFLPLTVDYQEKFAAAGRIPGGFLRREARLTDNEILISRLVDRALRPLFPDDYTCETQVLITLISADKNIMSDTLAGLAASAALAVSDIPFKGPISEVRVAKIDGKFQVNPYITDLERAEIAIIVAASIDNIVMVEGEMNECSEADLIEALKFAHDAIKIQCKAQLELMEMCNSKTKREIIIKETDKELEEKITKQYLNKIETIAKSTQSKHNRSTAFKNLREEFIASLPEDHEIDLMMVEKIFHDLEKDVVRKMILNENVRLDGRKTNNIRPIWCEIDYIPSAHGSAIFTRGETQSLTTVTLGGTLDEQRIDSATFQGYNTFMLHYNFPSFSTGEIKPNRGPGRREIGHGNLAMRSLKNVLPKGDENPYTIRIVSDILESNGSSSMATVCAGSLALLDAGIKIKSPVAGIAMGLIMDEKTGKYAILSDILGDEDHLGDMDFKVTGTDKGILACQMDIKINGLSFEILTEALQQAKEGRLHILKEMAKTISKPKPELKPHAPKMTKFYIPKDTIGTVIGSGGKVIQELQKESGTVITIDEKNEQGEVSVSGTDTIAITAITEKIKLMIKKPAVGETYIGKVKSIMPFGAFVEILPGKEGLLHISEISWQRVETVEGLLEVGQKVEVKLIEIDAKSGKYRLSKKVLTPRENKQNQKEKVPN